MSRKDDGINVDKGYINFYVGSILIPYHRFMWEEANGPIPKGYMVHHIDGDRQNNNLSNLKLVSRSEHGKIHPPKGRQPTGYKHSDKIKEKLREAWVKRNRISFSVETLNRMSASQLKRRKREREESKHD